jgi:hypothetical protein
MTFQTVESSSFEEYNSFGNASREEHVAREERLIRFPHSVMLKVSVPEMDFANRWCWQNFGPCDGKCNQLGSEYSVCERADRHSHVGKWMTYFFVKNGVRLRIQ